VCMSIISSCVLLGGAPYLQRWGADLVSALGAYMGNVRERGALLLLPPLDLVLQTFPQEAPQLLQPALLKMLSLMLGGQVGSTVWALHYWLCRS
jgi:hypothetical protein